MLKGYCNAFQTKMWCSDLIKFRAITEDHFRNDCFFGAKYKPASENIYFYVADLEVPSEMSVKLALSKT